MNPVDAKIVQALHTSFALLLSVLLPVLGWSFMTLHLIELMSSFKESHIFFPFMAPEGAVALPTHFSPVKLILNF